MCGFAGFVDRRPREDRRRTLLAMGRQLARRGPDDQTVFLDDRLSFVFRRLAIIDVAHGRQPIWNEDGSVFVAVNGEIYNHRDLREQLRDRHMFRSGSDAEVVLHLFEDHGPAMLEKLLGMFAIAIWDTRTRRLFLARDRLGKKPLYYSSADGCFLFGSELKALLVHPECPRDMSLADFESADRLPTFVSGVHQIPGGHFLVLDDDGGTRLGRYWSIEQAFGDRARSRRAYVDEYARLFEDSIAKRLMSEVPVGVFLSGGLDSSMIAAAAAAKQSGLHCFHVLERNTWSVGDTDAASRLAGDLDIPFHPVLMDERHFVDALDFSLAAFEYFVWMLDCPRFDLEWVFKHELHRYAKTVVPNLKVILLGQGADEFAGGYSKPFDCPRASWQQYLDTDVRERLAVEDRDRTTPANTYRAEMLRRTRLLQVHNLWHEDRTSAAQGVEGRMPFLDHRLVELLASVPPALHETFFWDKRIIRDVANRWLPPRLTERPKVRFFLGNKPGGIGRLLVALVKRVFPAFRDKYLSPGPLFATDRLVRRYEHTVAHEDGQSAQQLCNCMAVGVFERMLADIGDEAPATLTPPSTLCEASPDRWAELWEEESGLQVQART